MKHLRTKTQAVVASHEPSVRESLARALDSNGFGVFHADTGDKVLRTMRDHLVDVIILDHGTPMVRRGSPEGRRGALEAITDASPFLPVLLLCGPRTELTNSALLMADMVLRHPVDTSILLAEINTVLGETLQNRARRKAADLALLR